jgi:hypothetical protein
MRTSWEHELTKSLTFHENFMLNIDENGNENMGEKVWDHMNCTSCPYSLLG